MREVYFETENAIFRFYCDDVVEILPYYESTLGTAEATTLCDLLYHSDHGIRRPREQYRFAYLALELMEKGGGILNAMEYKSDHERGTFLLAKKWK